MGTDGENAPRIGLIHATPVAIDPIQKAMAALWPSAEVVNVLDDSLSVDRARGMDEASMSERILTLTRYAETIGCHAILFTCSAFSGPIERAASLASVPVLKPNEAMFSTAIRKGGKIAMLYTFVPARAGMEQEFRVEADRTNPSATLSSFLVEGAMDALRGGDAEHHNRLVAEAGARIHGFDAITLAHFSTSRAREAVEAVTDIPVLTSPDTAIGMLKDLLLSAPSSPTHKDE